ncbi:LysR family transcriptional regulator [Paracidobacterium acidisoli]|uniref:LysR family transcriptional regulator n=1 Tax=Paracidobacterium acidisoli TaxID=2303751 RepID=A0A372IPT9_9BACT|nr:LysR family transcriptional regulator [Paracidobacterium acidisoli]MBT9331215.1 LysR family transcriptional regulator [Paracidobacterium acidisoli]
MDFEQLRTFLEVSRLKSFSRAAQKLLRTQPAISAQIRSLEQEIGARLFDREGGKVTFTAAGRLFEPFAEHCLECQSHIHLAIAELERSPRGELSISANEATHLYVLPPVFAQFKMQYSRVILSIVRSERLRTLEAVLNREVDFGVVSLPVRDSRLAVEPIHRDDLALVVPPGHPFASRTTVRLQDMARTPLLLPSHGRRREQLNELFRTHELSPRVAMEVESSELLKRYILAGLGVGLLPRTNITEEERIGTLKAIPLEGVRLARDLALVYRKDKQISRAGQAFLEIASQAGKSK